MQELVDQGEKVHCVTIKQGWKELDTVQDYLRAGGEEGWWTLRIF